MPAVMDIIVRARDQASAVLQRVGAGSAGLAGKLDKAGASMSRTGTVMTRRLTLPLALLGGASVKAFASFDAAMTQSTAIMGDLDARTRKTMESVARTIGKTTLISATEAAEGYFFLASAGLDAAASIKAMPQVARFAQAGMFDMARATDLATDAQSALGLTVREDAVKNLENLTRVTDVLSKANVLSNATIEQFSESLTNKAGAALKVLDKDIEEGAAVLAAFADQGVKGTLAGNALAIVLRDLQTAALNNEDAWKKLGVATFDSQGEMRNIADIIGGLEDRLDGMSDKQKKATLSQLGFQDRSVQFILTLLGTSDAIRGYEDELRSAAGTTKEIADKQVKSAEGRFKLLKDRIIDVAISLGEKLMPVAEDIGGAIAGVAESFGNLSPGIQGTILKVGGLLLVAGPLLRIFGALATTGGKLLRVLAWLGGAQMAGAAAGVGALASRGGQAIVFLTGATSAAGMAIPQVSQLGQVGGAAGAGLGGMAAGAGRLGRILRGGGLILGAWELGTAVWNSVRATGAAEASLGRAQDAMADFSRELDIPTAKVGTARLQDMEAQAKALRERFDSLDIGNPFDWVDAGVEAFRHVVPGLRSVVEEERHLEQQSEVLQGQLEAGMTRVLMDLAGVTDLTTTSLGQVGAATGAWDAQLSNVILNMANFTASGESVLSMSIDQKGATAALVGQYQSLGGNMRKVNLELLDELLQSGKVTEALDYLNQTVNRATGAWLRNARGLFRNKRAYEQWAPAIAQAQGLTEDQRRTLARTIGTLARHGIKLKGATQDQLTAALAAGEYDLALRILGGALDTAGRKAEGSRKKTRDYKAALDDIPPKVRTKFQSPGLVSSQSTAGNLLGTLQTIAGQTWRAGVVISSGPAPSGPGVIRGGGGGGKGGGAGVIRPHGGGLILHAGGAAFPRYHDGSLAPNEVMAILERGEWIWSERATRNFGPRNLAALHAAFASGTPPAPAGARAGGRVRVRDTGGRQFGVVQGTVRVVGLEEAVLDLVIEELGEDRDGRGQLGRMSRRG